MFNENLDKIIFLMNNILLKYDEKTKKYRPIKGTTKEECYNTLGEIQELLGTNKGKFKYDSN